MCATDIDRNRGRWKRRGTPRREGRVRTRGPVRRRYACGHFTIRKRPCAHDFATGARMSQRESTGSHLFDSRSRPRSRPLRKIAYIFERISAHTADAGQKCTLFQRRGAAEGRMPRTAERARPSMQKGNRIAPIPLWGAQPLRSRAVCPYALRRPRKRPSR